MTNPCKECIVKAMCSKVCPDVIDIMKDIMKSYNAEITYDNSINIQVLNYLAINLRDKAYTDGPFYFLCRDPNNRPLRLHVKHKNGKLIAMRLGDG